MIDPLPVNEIFETIQGEGHFTGTPAVFIRLQGCPVGCPWCDTHYTWALREQDEIAINDMLNKQSGEQSWASLSVLRIIDICRPYMARHIVITGGEPCMHDLRPLTVALLASGRSVQIETSGTYPILCDERTWVTVSPKIDMPGGLDVQPDALARADELKMPIGKSTDITRLQRLLETAITERAGDRIYLQPISLSHKATKLCVLNAIANGFKVSLQAHALAGLR